MEEKKIRVAITQGDTNGVGYEVILKVFEEQPAVQPAHQYRHGCHKDNYAPCEHRRLSESIQEAAL